MAKLNGSCPSGQHEVKGKCVAKPKVMSSEQTSKWFQGGPKGVASRMKRNPSFKAGMEKYYGATLDESGKMIKKRKKK